MKNIINVINECIYHDTVLTITGDEYWLQKVTGQVRSRVLLQVEPVLEFQNNLQGLGIRVQVVIPDRQQEPLFVNLLRSPGIYSQPRIDSWLLKRLQKGLCSHRLFQNSSTAQRHRFLIHIKSSQLIRRGEKTHSEPVTWLVYIKKVADEQYKNQGGYRNYLKIHWKRKKLEIVCKIYAQWKRNEKERKSTPNKKNLLIELKTSKKLKFKTKRKM